MPGEGWPMFAEQAARKALTHYGGNKIPRSYLDNFNAATDAWLKRIGARLAETELEGLPDSVAAFAKEL